MNYQPEIIITLILNTSKTYQLRLTPNHYQQQFRQFLRQHHIPPSDAYYYKNIIQAKLMTLAKQQRQLQSISNRKLIDKPSKDCIQYRQQMESPKFRVYGIDDALSKLSPEDTSDRQKVQRKQICKIGQNLNLKEQFEERVQQSYKNNSNHIDKNEIYTFKKHLQQNEKQLEQKQKQSSSNNKQLNKQLQYDHYYNANYLTINQIDQQRDLCGQNQQELEQMPFLPAKSQKTTAISYQPQKNSNTNKKRKSHKNQKIAGEDRKNYIDTNESNLRQSTPCLLTQNQLQSNNQNLLSSPKKQAKKRSKSPSSPQFMVFNRLHNSPTESFKNKKNKQINPKQFEEYREVQLFLMNNNLRRVSPTLFNNLHKNHTQSFRSKLKSQRDADSQPKEQILKVSKHVQKKSIEKCFKGSIWQSGCRCEMKEYLKTMKMQEQKAKKRQEQIQIRIKDKSLEKDLNVIEHKSRSCQKCTPKKNKQVKPSKKIKPKQLEMNNTRRVRPYLNNLLLQCMLQQKNK